VVVAMVVAAVAAGTGVTAVDRRLVDDGQG
jgi:hypothetical protein